MSVGADNYLVNFRTWVLSHLLTLKNKLGNFYIAIKSYLDSISHPTAPVSSVEGGDDTTRPLHRPGLINL
jgi:hypothetical protein